MTSETKSNDRQMTDAEIRENFWAIRECRDYREEYDDCTSFKARFHQYFIHGESIDCTPWKSDYENCVQFAKSDQQDLKSAKAIILSEEKRRYDRLKAHYSNDTWTKRKAPPDDWSKPLPEYLLKKYENTFLDLKAREMRGEAIDQKHLGEQKDSSCSVM